MLAIILGAFGWLGPVWGLFVLITTVAILAAVLFTQFWTEMLAIGIIWAMLAALLLPAPSGAPEAPRRSQCSNNLKQIGLALYNYHDQYGSFPPAYIADENGRPVHSWRVLILPFLEQQPLYDQYRFDEPWDGPNNRRLHGLAMPVYHCPGGPPSRATNYLAVIGPRTVWQGQKTTRLSDIADGSSNTLLVVEVAKSGIHWMEPRDLHVLQMARGINPKAGQGISSIHPGCANVSFADGSVRFLPDDFPPDLLDSLLSIDGGEKIDSERW